MKKGISDLVAWVLLIGFAVSLGVFVTRWSLQQAEKSTSGVEEMIMGDVQCNDVAIYGVCEKNANGANTGYVIITNKGTLTITLTTYENNMLRDKGTLVPKGFTSLPAKLNGVKITYTPKLVVEDKIILCTDQKQDFEC